MATKMTILHKGTLDFIALIKIIFMVHLKNSYFWPSAEAKRLSNDLVHAMPLQCQSPLPMCIFCEVYSKAARKLPVYCLEAVPRAILEFHIWLGLGWSSFYFIFYNLIIDNYITI
jgi:hypothetical protein